MKLEKWEKRLKADLYAVHRGPKTVQDKKVWYYESTLKGKTNGTSGTKKS